MKIINIYIEQPIHQRMQTFLKIDLKRCEQITTLAQGIIVASTAILALPHPFGLITAGVSLLTSVMLAFPNFIRLTGDEDIERPIDQEDVAIKETVIIEKETERSVFEEGFTPTKTAVISDNVLYSTSSKKRHKIDFEPPLDLRHIASEKPWKGTEASAKVTYWRTKTQDPSHETGVREPVGSRNIFDYFSQEKEPVRKNTQGCSNPIPASRPTSGNREPVGTREV